MLAAEAAASWPSTRLRPSGSGAKRYGIRIDQLQAVIRQAQLASTAGAGCAAWASVEIRNPGCSSSVMAAPPTTRTPLEHERLQAAPREHGCRHQAVVAAADEDDVVRSSRAARRISSAALRPGAPMMPPPGCVADPHM